MYSNIAYANNVLEHLEKFSPSDMQFYNIYKGGFRFACLHAFLTCAYFQQANHGERKC